MNWYREQWMPFYGIFKREVLRFLKIPWQTVGSSTIGATLYLIVFGISVVAKEYDNLPYLTFLIPGAISMTCINNSFDNATGSIVTAKYTNELQDLRVTPISIEQIIWSKSLSSAVRAFIVGIFTYLIGNAISLCYYHQSLSIAHPFWLFYFGLIGSCMCACTGIATGMYATNFEQINAVGTFIISPLVYLGGIFFPLKGAQLWIQVLSCFNPLFYMINGIRYSFTGQSDADLRLAILSVTLVMWIAYRIAHISLREGRHYLR